MPRHEKVCYFHGDGCIDPVVHTTEHGAMFCDKHWQEMEERRMWLPRIARVHTDLLRELKDILREADIQDHRLRSMLAGPA